MDKNKSYPTRQEAREAAETKLESEGWTRDPSGHPGH